jgi:hypothetical protein
MSKKLTSRRFPFLPLSIRVRVAKGKHLTLDTHALIDTGFSGDIVVPATKELLQSTPGAYATWTMADLSLRIIVHGCRKQVKNAGVTHRRAGACS